MQNQPTQAEETIKVAVALRAARTAIGWSQQEFADKLGVAKSTIARIETMESVASAVVLMRAMQLLREGGVTVDLLTGKELTFHVASVALEEAARRLQDEQRRRVDRKKKGGATDS
jgi:transcriptional regulator with XRE-family HTH domain